MTIDEAMDNGSPLLRAGAIYQARSPRKDGTRKHVVIQSASKSGVVVRVPETGKSQRMRRGQFIAHFRPSNGKDDSRLWGEPAAASVAVGPEMRKLKKALEEQPHSPIKNVIYRLTPALATELVATAEKRNRQSSDARIRLYGHDTSKGHWTLTHQGIAVGPDMELVDGEHRCRSVMVSGVTVDVQVSQYTSRAHCEQARKNMDAQYTRSKAHVVEIDGLVERGKGRPVVATVEAMRLIDARLPDQMTKAEVEEVLKWRKASIAAVHSRATKDFLAGVRAALVIAHMKSPAEIEAMVEAVASRANIPMHSAAQVMAQRLASLQRGTSKAAVASAARETLAMAYMHVRSLKPHRKGKRYIISSDVTQKAIKFFLGEDYRKPTV